MVVMQPFRVRTDFEGLNELQKKVFGIALGRWESVIQGWRLPASQAAEFDVLELRVMVVPFDNACALPGADNPAARVDPDLLELVPASAPCQANLPKKATIQIDQCDLRHFLSHVPDYRDIFTHEIGHALGLIRKVFDRMGLLQMANQRECLFEGREATKAYAQMLARSVGATAPPPGVPMEKCGSHWKEEIFGDELMTSHNSGQRVLIQPLSSLTVAALDDIGYAVNTSREAYVLPRPATPAPVA